MELLLPAGDIGKAYTAFRYGADAIYCGVPMFSLRTRENKFTEENIQEIVNFAHENRKKVYVTTNAFPHQNMVKLFEKHLAFLETIKPDGIIFADLGVLAMANEHAPSVPKHLSVQTSTMNVPAMKMWQSMGVERVILAREMAIAEVAKIHEALPDLELEYFVHGAVCMAYSGRCLLSTFNAGRDANRDVAGRLASQYHRKLRLPARLSCDQTRGGRHDNAGRVIVHVGHCDAERTQLKVVGISAVSQSGQDLVRHIAVI